MRFTDLLTTSLASLWQRKFRTVLTVAGVTIGTIAVVVMVSLGIGLTESVVKSIESEVTLTRVSVSGPPQEKTGRGKPPRMDDKMAATLAGYEGVQHVIPVYEQFVSLKVGKYEGGAQLIAVPRESLAHLKLEIGEGNAPDAGVSGLTVGHMVSGDLYKPRTGETFHDSGESLLGEKITVNFETEGFAPPGPEPSQGGQGQEGPKLKPVETKVTGVLAGVFGEYSETSNTIYMDLDVLKKAWDKANRGKALPGQETHSNGKPKGSFTYNAFLLVTEDLKASEQVLKAVRDDGYQAYAAIEWIKAAQEQTQMIQAVFGGIGAVSLLVAAIGIANTMMMSVYERTKEIGVMKVLGAALRDIRALFLFEAAGIGLIGGVIGILGSYATSAVLNNTMGQGDQGDGGALGALGLGGGGAPLSVIPLWLAGATLVFATLIGTVAGLIPAHRATRLSALEAIRNQ